MKKRILVSFLLCVMLGLFGCATEEEPQLTDSQLSCEHEWVEIDWSFVSYNDGSGVGYDIYCPKCQTEENVSSKKWNKIQADMEYKNSK